MSFCSVIVWQAPSRVYGVITGYDVMFLKSGSGGGDVMVSKNRDELFHRVTEENVLNGEGETLVQVSPCNSVHWVDYFLISTITVGSSQDRLY